MKLDFRLLIVDNERRGPEAVEDLRHYLDERGFSLVETRAPDLSKSALVEVARQKGKDFDLVMVDFVLQEKHFGTDVLEWLREEMKYTEMVLYSAEAKSELQKRMKKTEGVFIAHKDDLEGVLCGLADIVIGKVVDLSQMRGIVMAEVAELEVHMTETIVRVLDGTEGARAREIVLKVLRDLMEKRGELSQVITEVLDPGGRRCVADVVEDNRIFSARWKWEGLKSFATELPPSLREDTKVLNRFNREILSRRNVLAHAREEMQNGKPVLQSHGGRRGKREVIDEEWMRRMRLRLRKHRRAMEAVCGAIVAEFGGMEADGEESSS